MKRRETDEASVRFTQRGWEEMAAEPRKLEGVHSRLNNGSHRLQTLIP